MIFRRRALFCSLLSLLSIPAISQDQRNPVPSPTLTSSPFQPPKGNDYTYVLNDGIGLDTGCTFRSGGPLQITLPIGRVLGDIGKLKQNGLVAGTIRIEFPAFDVDSSFSGSIPPERDRVSVNGNVVPGEFMTGINNTWVMQRFNIPIEWLLFPADPGTGAVQPMNNLIKVDIDTASGSTENWCTAVDWIAITLDNPIPPRPWIGAHGIFSMSGIWSGLWVPSLNNLGIPAAGGPDMGRLDSIQNNAGKIANSVEAARQRWGVDKVNIVAHSKGGLDSRHYIEGNSTVENLVQLGTPNAGSPLADALQSGSIRVLGVLGNIAANLLAGGVGGYQLTTVHMDLYNSFHGSNPQTRYLGIAGDYRPGSYFNDTWRRALTDLIVGPGDTIVPISSVHSLGFVARASVTSSYPDRGADHITMHGDQRFFNTALPRILAAGGPTSITPATVAPTLTSLAVPSVQRTESSAGRLAPGATTNLPVPIDPSSSVAFILFASDGNLEFTLRDPLGALIQPGSAGVNYEKSEIPGGWVFTYGFQGVIPTGNWTVQLRSTATGPVDFSVNAWLENAPVTMAAEAVPATGSINNSITFRATLRNGTLPISGATVRAFVAFPDGVSTQMVTLRDDGAGPDLVSGDGVYNGTFSSTSAAGVYGVAMTGTGDYLPGKPFSREVYTQATISASTSEILPGIQDSGRDLNQNGLFDQLVVTVPLRITASGTYRLAATMRDSAGNELSTSTAAALTTSSNSMELRFDGATIFSRGINGPYSIVSMRLAEELNGQLLPVAERTTPYLTAPYQFNQFEGGGLGLTGQNSAQGIDLNANSKFDRLRVAIGINVRTAGSYSWSARLRDRNGREITLGSSQGSLPAGVATIQIDFDGTAIGRNGVDGPYEVADLLLLGASSTLAVSTVFNTQAFAASAFEGFIVGSGSPRITAQVSSIVPLSGRQFRITLQLSNSGPGVGRNVFIQQVAFRVLAGPAGSVISLDTPTLPAFVGDLNPAESKSIQLTVSIPSGVTRLSISESGTVLDRTGQLAKYSAAQAVAVP